VCSLRHAAVVAACMHLSYIASRLDRRLDVYISVYFVGKVYVKAVSTWPWVTVWKTCLLQVERCSNAPEYHGL
jgi:hypothetical protein